MSRFCGDKSTTSILDAAIIWRDNCLLGLGSALGTESVWRPEYVEELSQYYVENLDWGEGNFLEKLSQQLSAASPQAKVLAAEMMWVMMLCPSNIGPGKKIENIQAIYEWSGQKLDLGHPLLQATPLLGIGSAGTAYNNLRWKELVYFVVFLQQFFSESAEKRQSLMSDGQLFSVWLEQLQENEKRQLRHMFLFLLFPDEFERIFGKSDRVKCILAFTEKTKADVKQLSARELDAELASTRASLAEEYNTDKLDWYVPPLRAFWQNTSKGGETSGTSIFETLEKFIDQSKSGESATRSYPSKHEALELRVSFGQGNQAHVTWIAFLAPGQTPTKGIYPVYLYYKTKDLLVLSKGISATHAPELAWPGDGLQSISSYFDQHYAEEPIRYGNCLVDAVYDLSDTLDQQEVDDDLHKLITEYKAVVSMDSIEPVTKSKVAPKSGPEVVPDYSLEKAMEGLFLEDHQVQHILQLLRSKKNIILQGPPGVGKTFVCKRLAYALMETSDPTRVGMVQFHQSYSYEDFVQGFRPSGTGFTLRNGVFHNFCERARSDPENDYVFIIDEINRGNLSKIFGELMMLIENDKRGENWAVPLTYADSDSDSEAFYVPHNLHLIGLMNTADRSLAMVDYALRRRFAYVDLAPAFSSQKFKSYLAENGAPEEIIQRITSRMAELNARISADKADLGSGFCIGHSFFCSPPYAGEYDVAWYDGVVRSEIVPLILEYWFDDQSTADSVISQLLAP
jgi:MoxR-like ATPase